VLGDRPRGAVTVTVRGGDLGRPWQDQCYSGTADLVPQRNSEGREFRFHTRKRNSAAGKFCKEKKTPTHLRSSSRTRRSVRTAIKGKGVGRNPHGWTRDLAKGRLIGRARVRSLQQDECGGRDFWKGKGVSDTRVWAGHQRRKRASPNELDRSRGGQRPQRWLRKDREKWKPGHE